MAAQKPFAETWFGYWDVRIRDPKLFNRIRTPDWSSLAATEMAKEWIVSAINNFSISPHLIPDSALIGINFYRNESTSQEQVHARQGQMEDQQWITQSVIIPQNLNYKGKNFLIPPEIAHEIACYIARRLDKSDDIETSPYCKAQRTLKNSHP